MITPGQAHDVTAYPALMEEVDDNPEQMLADKGYDSDAVRDDIQKRGGEALIPTRAPRKVQRLVNKAIYALRNRIERFFNEIKNSREYAARYDKLVEAAASCSSLQIRLSIFDLSTRPSREEACMNPTMPIIASAVALTGLRYTRSIAAC